MIIRNSRDPRQASGKALGRQQRASVSWLALVAAGCVAATPMLAQAQEATKEATKAQDSQQSDVVDEIIVSGIRKSLAAAREVKRDAPNLVEAISAEDIGKFPDRNLAESLQRVTGVQITRNKGEGESVSVRGLSPQFTRTLYNGRVLSSPTGGRDFSFTSLATDFISAVEVSKTPTADMIDGGLSATINVKVARPLDVGKNRFAMTAESIYEKNPKKVSPHISGMVNRVFLDGTLGVNLGVNYEKRNVIQGGFTGYGLETRREQDNVTPLDYNQNGAIDGAYQFDHATTFVSDEGTFKRKSVVGGVQWKPTDDVNLYADAMYTDFTDGFSRFEHQLRWTNITGPGAAIRGSKVGENNILTFLDADGVDHQTNNLLWVTNDKTFASGLGGDITSGRLTFHGEFSFSRAQRNLKSFTSATPKSWASASYNLGSDFSAVPEIKYTRGYDPLNSANYTLGGVFSINQRMNVTTNLDSRFDVNYEFDEGFVRKISAGLYSGNNEVDFRRSRYYNIGADYLSKVTGSPYNATSRTISANGLLRKVDYSRFIGDALGVFLVPDYDKMFAGKTLEQVYSENTPTYDNGGAYTIREQVAGAYVRADFAGFDDRLKGNAGLRFVETQLRTDGFGSDIANAVVQADGVSVIVPAGARLSVKNTYKNWLPSLNLRYELGENLLLRFGAARALTRPDLNMLNPATSVNTNTRQISSQNPYLRPYLADQADLSLEYYFGSTGLISAAVFYKDLKNYIISTDKLEDLTLKNVSGGTVTYQYRHTQPDNGANGKIKGIELGVQAPLDFLPSPFDGFGVTSNVTLLDVGDVTAAATGVSYPLSGVSKRSYTLGGYYEKYGFGLRGSYTYRSGYVGSVSGYFGDGNSVKAYGQFDVSANYDINDHFALTFSANNITGAKSKQVNKYDVLVNNYDFGRRYTAALRVKF